MLALLMVLACDGGGKEDSAGGGDLVGDSAKGATLYDSCAGCHGADGTLATDIDGTAAADLTVRVPALDDAEITDQVKNGGTAMPAQLSEPQDIVDVIAYLRETFP